MLRQRSKRSSGWLEQEVVGRRSTPTMLRQDHFVRQFDIGGWMNEEHGSSGTLERTALTKVDELRTRVRALGPSPIQLRDEHDHRLRSFRRIHDRPHRSGKLVVPVTGTLLRC